MESAAVIVALGALAQEHRLAAFRLLVQAGADGLPAGAIAESLGVVPSSLSFHLAQLSNAGLITQRRQSRQIFYAADYAAMNALMGYLTENCCGGAPCVDAPACCTPEDVTAGITIYHNPECGTSRNTLAMIRNAGIEPRVIEYLKTPPSRVELLDLISRMGISPRDLLRQKGTPHDALGLNDPTLADDRLIDAMMAHPILINRPIVVSPLGVKLCRPSEMVLDILPSPQRGGFAKEDGEQIVGATDNRVGKL